MISYIRLAIILSLLTVVGCHGGVSTEEKRIAKEAFAALGEIQAATQVGVSYLQYRAMLIGAKAKVNAAEQTLSTSTLKDLLHTTIKVYEEAATVWSVCLEHNIAGNLCKHEALLDAFPNTSGILELRIARWVDQIAYVSTTALLARFWETANGKLTKIHSLLEE